MKVKPIYLIIAAVVAFILYSNGSQDKSAPAPAVNNVQVPSTTTGNSTDDQFIMYINAVDSSMVGIFGEAQLIETAHTTCDFFRRGGTLAQYGEVAQSTIGTDYASTLAAAAILAYCPDQKYLVPNS